MTTHPDRIGAFVAEYLRNGRKGAQAYRVAFNRPDLDPKSCAQRASRLLKNRDVMRRIAQTDETFARRVAVSDAELAKKREMSSDIVAKLRLEEDRYLVSRQNIAEKYATMGFTSMGDFIHVDESGNVTFDFGKVTLRQWAAVQEINVKEYVEGTGKDAKRVIQTKFRLYDARAALESLAKMFGWDSPPPGTPEADERRAIEAGKARASVLAMLETFARPEPVTIQANVRDLDAQEINPLKKQ